jgi:hypothetical protein
MGVWMEIYLVRVRFGSTCTYMHMHMHMHMRTDGYTALGCLPVWRVVESDVWLASPVRPCASLVGMC